MVSLSHPFLRATVVHADCRPSERAYSLWTAQAVAHAPRTLEGQVCIERKGHAVKSSPKADASLKRAPPALRRPHSPCTRYRFIGGREELGLLLRAALRPSVGRREQLGLLLLRAALKPSAGGREELGLLLRGALRLSAGRREGLGLLVLAALRPPGADWAPGGINEGLCERRDCLGDVLAEVMSGLTARPAGVAVLFVARAGGFERGVPAFEVLSVGRGDILRGVATLVEARSGDFERGDAERGVAERGVAERGAWPGCWLLCAAARDFCRGVVVDAFSPKGLAGSGRRPSTGCVAASGVGFDRSVAAVELCRSDGLGALLDVALALAARHRSAAEDRSVTLLA